MRQSDQKAPGCMIMAKKYFYEYDKPEQKKLFNLAVQVALFLPKGALTFGQAIIKCNDGTQIKTKKKT